MSRPALLLLVVGLLGAVTWWALAGSVPAYFAGWLFWIGVPMGALPLVMAMEGAGAVGSPLLPVMRAMLPLLPLGILFALPVLRNDTFARRDGVMLAVLSLLALAFWIAPRRPRRRLAAVGLLVSLVLGTVLGVDWVPAPGASLAGLLLIAGQVALAGTVAGLALAVGTDARERLPGAAGLLIGLLVAFWVFLQFTQYLVVWSANLPAEAGWYLDRLAGSGTAIVAFAAVAGLAAITLLPSLLGRIPAAMATISAMFVIAQLLVTFRVAR